MMDVDVLHTDTGERIVRRSERVGRLLPVPALAACLGLAAIAASSGLTPTAHSWLTVGLCVGAAVWAVVVIRPVSRRGRRWRAVAWVGQFAFGAALVHVSPFFGIYALTGYLLVDLLPVRWRRLALALTALPVAAAQVGGYPTTAAVVALYAALWVVNVALVVTFVTVNDEMLHQNERLAAALAENAGLHAQLVRQAREAGTLDERQRLAGEIHDTLAQGLIGIVTQLEAADQAGQRPEQSQRHLDQARDLARANLVEARRSVRALRPGQLDSDDLTTALRAYVRRWADAQPAQLSIEVSGDPRPLGDDVEATLFRVAQEALANVAKHATAAKVGVTLTFLTDVVVLDVRDDGVGFDPAARTDGYGLAGMRRRVDGVGGRLVVETAGGEGVAVSATVPTPAVPTPAAPVPTPAAGSPSSSVPS